MEIGEMLDELLDALGDMVHQHCTVQNNKGSVLDSMALSANADAMRLLAKYNRIAIDSQCGRRIIAHWIKEENG